MSNTLRLSIRKRLTRYCVRSRIKCDLSTVIMKDDLINKVTTKFLLVVIDNEKERIVYHCINWWIEK